MIFFPKSDEIVYNAPGTDAGSELSHNAVSSDSFELKNPEDLSFIISMISTASKFVQVLHSRILIKVLFFLRTLLIVMVSSFRSVVFLMNSDIVLLYQKSKMAVSKVFPDIYQTISFYSPQRNMINVIFYSFSLFSTKNLILININLSVKPSSPFSWFSTTQLPNCSGA